MKFTLAAAFMAALFLLLPPDVQGTIIVDGDFAPGEWNPAVELRAANTDAPWLPGNNLVNLYVSWDVTNLYVGVEGFSSTNNVFFIYIDSSNRSAGSGVYFCSMTAGGFSKSIKLVLLR
jgi:hypothetical protein